MSRKVTTQEAHLIGEVFNEYLRAIEKHPVYLLDKGGKYTDAAGIVVEEAGELMRSALQYTFEGRWAAKEEMRKEALQTAASAFRFLMEFDSRFNNPFRKEGKSEVV